MSDNIMEYDAIMKIIILGDSGVGKTNILTRYKQDKFSEDAWATIGVEFTIKKYKLQNGGYVRYNYH